MTAIGKMCVRTPVLLICALTLGTAGCGDDDFKDEPRAAVPIELSGVIKPDRVIVSPDRVGAGPVRITISNQTEQAHRVTLEGNSVAEEVGPVYPEDTARIEKTLQPGRYEVRVGAPGRVTRGITAAVLRIGRPRPESNDRLLLP